MTKWPRAFSSDPASAAHPLEFFHGDHLASSRLLTDASGQRTNGSETNYAPYGTLLGSAGSLTSYAFTGQFRDSDLNLQYHRARWHSSLRGAWLSIDAVLDFPGNLGNPYAYVGSSPVSRRDAVGLFSLGELNVSSAIQVVLTQVVVPNVVSAMMRTVLAAAGVDLSL